MYHFFVPEIQETEDVIRITGEDVNHIRNVLRLRTGDLISVENGSGREYLCRIRYISPEEVTAAIEDITECAAELPVRITLYQGVPKSGKMDFIIQKAVELGAARIVPVMMQRTVGKLDDKKKAHKIERYLSISESAAKQSGRGIIPEIGSFMDFQEALTEAAEAGMVLVPYECAGGLEQSRCVFRNIAAEKDAGRLKYLSVFIGPEGGFSDGEIRQVREKNGEIVTLGNRILRTETAGMAVLSILSFLLDEDRRK